MHDRDHFRDHSTALALMKLGDLLISAAIAMLSSQVGSDPCYNP